MSSQIPTREKIESLPVVMVTLHNSEVEQTQTKTLNWASKSDRVFFQSHAFWAMMEGHSLIITPVEQTKV